MDALAILNKWQQFLKDTDTLILNVPVGISMMTSGKILVKWSLFQPSMYFDTMEECLVFINKTVSDLNLLKGK